MQTNLFQDTSKKIQLYKAIDDVKNKWGKYSIVKAGGIEATSSPEETTGGMEGSRSEQRQRTRDEGGHISRAALKKQDKKRPGDD
jgi:hypothetical protein